MCETTVFGFRMRIFLARYIGLIEGYSYMSESESFCDMGCWHVTACRDSSLSKMELELRSQSLLRTAHSNVPHAVSAQSSISRILILAM